MPPSTTTTKAVSANGTPAVGVTGKTGVKITPAAAARAQPRPKLSMLRRVVSTPFSSAISRSWLAARMMRPNQVFLITKKMTAITAAPATRAARR